MSHDRDERRGHLPMTQSVRYDWERQGHRIPTPPPLSAGMVYAFQGKLSRGDASSSSGSGHAIGRARLFFYCLRNSSPHAGGPDPVGPASSEYVPEDVPKRRTRLLNKAD